MNNSGPEISAPVDERPTAFGWFCVFLLFLGSACVTGFLVYQVWAHIALIAALFVSAVLTMVGFEMWEETHPTLE